MPGRAASSQDGPGERLRFQGGRQVPSRRTNCHQRATASGHFERLQTATAIHIGRRARRWCVYRKATPVVVRINKAQVLRAAPKAHSTKRGNAGRDPACVPARAHQESEREPTGKPAHQTYRNARDGCGFRRPAGGRQTRGQAKHAHQSRYCAAPARLVRREIGAIGVMEDSALTLASAPSSLPSVRCTPMSCGRSRSRGPAASSRLGTPDSRSCNSLP